MNALSDLIDTPCLPGNHQVPAGLPVHNPFAFEPSVVTQSPQVFSQGLPVHPAVWGGPSLSTGVTGTLPCVPMLQAFLPNQGVEDDVVTECGSPRPDLSPPLGSGVFSCQSGVGSQINSVSSTTTLPRRAGSNVARPRSVIPGRPSDSYVTMIKNAILSKPDQRATLSQIYEYVSEKSYSQIWCLNTFQATSLSASVPALTPSLKQIPCTTSASSLKPLNLRQPF